MGGCGVARGGGLPAAFAATLVARFKLRTFGFGIGIVRARSSRVPLTLHLLSPARRPVQVTRDLKSFWKNGYPEVKRDLKGRYPKHHWPDDPLGAAPDSAPAHARAVACEIHAHHVAGPPAVAVAAPALAGLVDKSLVRQLEAGSGEARFGMLEHGRADTFAPPIRVQETNHIVE